MKIGIKVLGCPKNEADCDVLEAILRSRGHEIVYSVDAADTIVIDTCCFIEEAKRESIDEILDFIEYKKKKSFFLCVKGCLVQRYAPQLVEELPEVDAWYGVLSPQRLAEALEKRVRFLVEQPETVYECAPRSRFNSYAYVKIADGCDRNCTFCAIPVFKGRFRSRSIESIEAEVRELVRNGVKELVLVAQDTTAYGIDLYGKPSLPKLLRVLDSVEGEFRLRIMYMHPDHFDEEILSCFCNARKVLHYFDLPVQHGSDEVLARMGRVKKSDQLLEMIFSIRKALPDAAIRSSVIVGFPGEKEKNFEELLEFLKVAKFERLGCFVYSDEEGTPASELQGKVDEEIAKERMEEVLSLQAELARESLSRFVGEKLQVLVEKEAKNHYIARSHLDAPEVDGIVKVRKNGKLNLPSFQLVRILDTDGFDLRGVLV
ncbi:MAG: Ribosomal protein S12 methylthiotransferase RimO [Thermotoga sp. 50_1627]|nr:MAG: Ribosomal protein S12 methylthiotransferase RimO [Thermotoga sp. 50_64]KUK25646.1 MAG: Ribosomal protein S12 methylthiotransferase RimO [Thermotoga sp. 50_1627]MDK2923045.1 ribosomal protein methylthiotransferase [Pseudothermotoga sp.]HBT40024.1 30S ribosomal protein S12 methylthiotransferase RimO [Pseudothermotoga sp.]HCO98433.1 30S ribosomal protein S12 methylthiotransferase RimO [Pseudothermotoga sp.]